MDLLTQPIGGITLAPGVNPGFTHRASMPFLQACQNIAPPRPPIWLMRQAGRYMADYRRLREKYSLLEMVKTPELACEVTLQPIHAFGMDAAIIFADILPLLEAMGMQLEFVSGEGPVLHNPIRSAADVDRLTLTEPEETLAFTLDAIRLVRPELDTKKIPLIGFSGAPFTLAAYAIEGGGSREHRLTKQLMWSEPEAWHALMNKLSKMIGKYLVAQANAGAQVLQIFDSWAGALSARDYREFALPYVRQTVEAVRSAAPQTPIIYFSTGTGTYQNLVAECGADVMSVDWRADLLAASKMGKPVQGNLDPVMLFAPWPTLKKEAERILSQMKGTNFIFNLGHGILQHTPEDNVKRLVELVRES